MREEAPGDDRLGTVPRRLFASRLIGGLHEFAAYLVLPAGGAERAEAIHWRISSVSGEIALRARRAPLSEEARMRGAFPIAATLPRSWDGGVLMVEVDIGGSALSGEYAIERFEQQASFRLPLPGQALVVVGHRLGEGHRAALQVPSQQFGWDFVALGDDGLRLLHGRMGATLRASDFACFGKEVMAPAGGRVWAVHNGAVDQERVGELPQDSGHFEEELTRALGNYVILRHDDGIWSVLAHLQHGSVVVQPGQAVNAGDLLGRLGNSGYSSGPHLHLHFMDGPDIVQASPLPVALLLEEGTFAPEAGNIIASG